LHLLGIAKTQTACVHTVLSKDPTTKPNKLMM
jgi:hypothetical protein